jgi:hypothetical protein
MLVAGNVAVGALTILAVFATGQAALRTKAVGRVVTAEFVRPRRRRMHGRKTSTLPLASPGSGGRLLHTAGARFGIQQCAELFAGFENGNFLRRNRDRFPGAGVARLAGCLIPNFEGSEPANVEALAALQGAHDCGKQGVNDFLRVLLAQFRGSCSCSTR